MARCQTRREGGGGRGGHGGVGTATCVQASHCRGPGCRRWRAHRQLRAHLPELSPVESPPLKPAPSTWPEGGARGGLVGEGWVVPPLPERCGRGSSSLLTLRPRQAYPPRTSTMVRRLLLRRAPHTHRRPHHARARPQQSLRRVPCAVPVSVALRVEETGRPAHSLCSLPRPPPSPETGACQWHPASRGPQRARAQPKRTSCCM